jgi:CubicO group peptidase (beta-lactamase class C family)
MNKTKISICSAVFALAFSAAIDSQGKAPYVDPAVDASNFGPPNELLFWTPEQQVASYRNIDKIFPTREILKGDYTLELPVKPQNLGTVGFPAADKTWSVDEYFVDRNVAGLLVIKDGNIAYERYGLGNNKDSLWISWSVAKSVTSMLVGAAIKDGYIKSVDDKVTDYLPLLKNSAYDQSTIRNLLQMASGVEWDETYTDKTADINTASFDTLGLYEYLRDKPRAAEPGEKFNYNTAETNIAGSLLRSAIGNNLATYLSEKIWKPFGMGEDANWMLSEPGGGEQGGCCISATLRDYARLGLFALADGQLADGTRVLPEGWMQESIAPSQGYDGYGYFWWLGSDNSFFGIGIFGQAIYINPAENVVIALHSARDVASEDADWALQYALLSALAQAVKPEAVKSK